MIGGLLSRAELALVNQRCKALRKQLEAARTPEAEIEAACQALRDSYTANQAAREAAEAKKRALEQVKKLQSSQDLFKRAVQELGLSADMLEVITPRNVGVTDEAMLEQWFFRSGQTLGIPDAMLSQAYAAATRRRRGARQNPGPDRDKLAGILIQLHDELHRK